MPSSLKVLIVDDNATNREILEAYVASVAGVEHASVGSGAEALQAMHTAARDGEPFELVLLDGQMPGMDGIELAQAIQLAPSLRDTRLVMLTSTTDRRQAAREAGIDVYLQKPVRRERLLEAIAETLGAAPEAPLLPAPAPVSRVGGRRTATRSSSSRTTSSTSASIAGHAGQARLHRRAAPTTAARRSRCSPCARTRSCSWTARCRRWTATRRPPRSAAASAARSACRSSP